MKYMDYAWNWPEITIRFVIKLTFLVPLLFLGALFISYLNEISSMADVKLASNALHVPLGHSATVRAFLLLINR